MFYMAIERLVGTHVRAAALVAITMLSPIVGPAGAAPPEPVDLKSQPYQLQGIRAYLFYQQSGSFEDRDLIPDKTGFVNVITGGGEAREPSGAILVLIDISGPKFGQGLPPSAALVVTTEGKNRKSTTTRISLKGFYSRINRISVPIVVYDTSCWDVEISARLQALGQGQHLQRTVPFSCNE